jgi:hypothetical protein
MRRVPFAYSAAASAVAALVIGGGAVLLPAASAQASILQTLTCQGSEFTTFSPSLTTTAATTYISTDDSFGPCASTDTTISGGLAYTQTEDPSASCDTLLGIGSGETTFIWTNGNSSTFSYTKTTTNLNGEIVSTETGPITSGEFAGNLATEVIVLPTLDLSACESGGISTASGSVTLEILPL